MKKNAGFTIIELLIAIVLMGIVFGSLVDLFSQSVKNQQAGVSQQEIFTQGRATMAQIKNTLRYASTDTIKFYNNGTETAITSSSTDFTGINKMTYTSTIFSKPYDATGGASEDVNITIEMQQPSGWTNKQLKVTKTIGTTTTTYLFPEKAANSLFTSTSNFPVIPAKLVSTMNVDLYKIDLPMQYTIAGSTKVEHLLTSVYPLAADATTAVIDPWVILRNRYIAIAKIIQKNANGTTLTGDETTTLNDYKTYEGTNTYLNNDKLRDYVYKKYYASAWPSGTVTYANGTTVTVYAQPYWGVSSTGDTDDAFIFCHEYSAQQPGWYTKYIYNTDTSKLYIRSSATTITSYTWSTLKTTILGSGWTTEGSTTFTLTKSST